MWWVIIYKWAWLCTERPTYPFGTFLDVMGFMWTPVGCSCSLLDSFWNRVHDNLTSENWVEFIVFQPGFKFSFLGWVQVEISIIFVLLIKILQRSSYHWGTRKSPTKTWIIWNIQSRDARRVISYKLYDSYYKCLSNFWAYLVHEHSWIFVCWVETWPRLDQLYSLLDQFFRMNIY